MFHLIPLIKKKIINADIKEFCEVNFNINFPLTTLTDVKGKNAHELFKWAKENHGKSAEPKWNFHKILINKEGKVQDTFASFTKPTLLALVTTPRVRPAGANHGNDTWSENAIVRNAIADEGITTSLPDKSVDRPCG